MNHGTIVRMDADERGATLRLWVDDEAGHHLTVAECRLTALQIGHLCVAIEREQERTDQYQLTFDD